MAGCGPVNIRPLVCATDSVTVCNELASAAVVTRIAAVTTTTTLLAANPNRKMAIFWNDSSSTIYLKFGPAAGITDFTWKLDANDGFELPAPAYAGLITGVWSSATGAIQVTELT